MIMTPLGSYSASRADWTGIPTENLVAGRPLGAIFDGTYDDVKGTYECADGCTADRNDDGALFITGILTFEPGDAETEVMVPDSDYLTFGFWLSKPDPDFDGAPDPMLELATFFNSVESANEDFNESDTALSGGVNLTALEGRATFEGPAAGKYVKRYLADDTGEVGIFTADAELTADFDADSTPDDDQMLLMRGAHSPA